MDLMPRSTVALMLTEFFAAHDTVLEVRLFTNDIELSPVTALGDLIEPIGTWYAVAAGVYGEVFAADDNGLQIDVGSVQFNYSGVSPPETIRGYAVVENAVTDILLHVAKLPEPKLMAGILDSLVILAQFVVPAITGDQV